MQATKIKQIVRGIPTQDGAGVTLTRIIGQPGLPRLDPFLMLDEFGSDKPQDYLAGFPEHPHRGFQTVTYMVAGKMEHRDSVGNTGLIETGGIQWMNAGKGIIHSEMPKQTEGLMRGFQLWVNLPSHEKMSEPNYQDIKAEQVPVVTDISGLEVKVLVGEFNGVTGPVTAQAVKPVFLDCYFSQTESLSLPCDSAHVFFVYCYEGELTFGSQSLNKGELAVLEPTTRINLQGNPQSRCIIVGGHPINEPIVQYGPFVMNTEQEIRQAYEDYRQGRFA
ncbi:pirin family protein [Paraglaciecola hydrolytica]|uniref:Pirin n=1 Tax=Paraglaciecola hydrolytica TaxID=1799789 RepID=A0A136A5W5_9ALTE|nr:pirin family protein [Paraglaciecola hydrolytica]KXI30638.1 pirin [Paraglaciecola hydrolytica]